jgi:hypothetical protein
MENNILKGEILQCNGSLPVVNHNPEQPTHKITQIFQQAHKVPQTVHRKKHCTVYYCAVRFYVSTLHLQT